MTDYERIAKAIEFIHINFKEQPNLNEVAEQVYLSRFIFNDCLKIGQV